jgi:rare lipoprotein A
MSCITPRALILACASFAAFAAAAAADPAPITYAANQDNPGTLAGGGARSYGYGAVDNASAPVIDLRPPSAQPPAQHTPAPQAAGQGRPNWLEQERVGAPYQANGRWYVPAAEPGYEATGTASWYGPTFHGQRTASGEVFDQEAITAAHPTLPIPSLVQVTNLENGREVIVRVNDRGPFVGDRVIDLSHGAAQVLGVERNGTARVHIRYLGPAPRHYGESAAPAPQGPVETASAPQGPASLLPPSAQSGQGASPSPVQAVAYQPAAPLPAGSYFVQVGAFSDVNNAHRVQEAVASAGPAAVDVRRNAAGVELFRVRIGPFPSREYAEMARRAAAALGYGEAVLAAP